MCLYYAKVFGMRLNSQDDFQQHLLHVRTEGQNWLCGHRNSLTLRSNSGQPSVPDRTYGLGEELKYYRHDSTVSGTKYINYTREIGLYHTGKQNDFLGIIKLM